MPLGFCCGGFSSTAGYVPGNEAHAFAMSGIASIWLFLSKWRCSFLSEQLEKSFDFRKQSLSASTQGVNSNYIPHIVALRQCVTAFACLSLCRSNARKQFRLWKWFYTCFFSCQVENTLGFAFIFPADFERTVENFLTRLWKILWKTSQVCLGHNLKIQIILTKYDAACAKLSKSLTKKIFK